ncbi:MAG: hypothetical protein R2825_17760 [Saprospiraceae bacterium]
MVFAGDPGHEHREDFKTMEKAALAGGYTAVACLPNTSPAIHSKSEVLLYKRPVETTVTLAHWGGLAQLWWKGHYRNVRHAGGGGSSVFRWENRFRIVA